MSQRERVRQYAKDVFNPVYLFGSAASAGIGLWRDQPPEWGQGGRGFGRRFASSYAQHIVSETLLFGASSALGEDNRYIRTGSGEFKHRLGYALKSTFLARHDDGSRHLSISKFGALGGASMISRAWQPPGPDRMRGAGVNFGVSVAAAMGLNVAREFLPDLLRRK